MTSVTEAVGGADRRRPPRPTSRVGSLLDALPDAVVITDTAHRVIGWNDAAERLFGVPRSSAIGSVVHEILASRLRSGTAADMREALERGEIWHGGTVAEDATGAELELRFTAAAMGAAEAREGYLLVAHDITPDARAERTAEMAEARFADFLAAAPAVAFIKDRRGRYLFVNEHASRMTGAARAWQGKTDYDLWPQAVAAQIRQHDGLTLAGTTPLESIQVVPLDDGPHTLLMRKFRLRGANGEALLGGLGIDITDRVRAEAKLRRGKKRAAHVSLLAEERAVVANALGRLRSSGSVETIASSVANEVLGLPSLCFAAVLLFELDGRATPIGLAVTEGVVPDRRTLGRARSRALRRRAEGGPWVEPWRPSARDPFNEVIRALDIGVVGYAPIRSGDELLGVLAVGADNQVGESSVTERLPAIVEYAGLAGVLLGSSVATRTEYRTARSEILAVIERRAFHPVFQPIVDLASRTTVGYEALTRFDDGSSPQDKFAEAAAVDLGPQLELATLDAALAAAAHLPPGLWLNINVSPTLVLAGDMLRARLRKETRAVVCEVTEHAAIEDYAAFRAAVARLGSVEMAVDDAGAGFSSLRHILELRPAFVKVDRSLVADINADPVRRALMVGMRHFAGSAGCRLVAEGIETEEELAALIALQVPLGQGYLLGPPASLTPVKPA